MLLYGILLLPRILLGQQLPLAHSVSVTYHDAHHWQDGLKLHVGIASSHHLAHSLEDRRQGRGTWLAGSRRVGILACGDDRGVVGFG